MSSVYLAKRHTAGICILATPTGQYLQVHNWPYTNHIINWQCFLFQISAFARHSSDYLSRLEMKTKRYQKQHYRVPLCNSMLESSTSLTLPFLFPFIFLFFQFYTHLVGRSWSLKIDTFNIFLEKIRITYKKWWIMMMLKILLLYSCYSYYFVFLCTNTKLTRN